MPFIIAIIKIQIVNDFSDRPALPLNVCAASNDEVSGNVIGLVLTNQHSDIL